jgi:lysophospholipase L1-like esterase
MPALIAGGVAVGLSFGNAPTAHAEGAAAPPPIKVDFIGDSQSAGEGLHGTYFDANDVRHQSRQAAPAQALARLQAANPDVAVDARVAAASGALTVDFFAPQQMGDTVVNRPQLEQLRPDADVVVVGFGASDAMATEVVHAAADPADDKAFDTLLGTIESGLSTLSSDQVYRDQARSGEPGLAATLTARLLQVLEATKAKALGARIVVTNYPILVDPTRSAVFAEFSADELTRLREFGQRLNAAVGRAVRICGCAALADVSGALEGRELGAEESAVNDLSAGQGGPAADHRAHEVFQPNATGAGLIAEPIVGALAKALSLTAPKPTTEPTETEGIALAPAVVKVEQVRVAAPEPAADRHEKAPKPVAGKRVRAPEWADRRRSEPVRREPERAPSVVREVVVVTRPVVHLVPVVVGAAPPQDPTAEQLEPGAEQREPTTDAEPRRAANYGGVEPTGAERRAAADERELARAAEGPGPSPEVTEPVPLAEKADAEPAEEKLAEQERTEEVRAEEERTEEERTEEVRAEEERAEEERTEEERTEEVRAEQGRTEEVRAEQGRTEEERAEQVRAEEERTEEERAEELRVEQERAEQEWAEAKRLAEVASAEVEQAEARLAEVKSAAPGVETPAESTEDTAGHEKAPLSSSAVTEAAAEELAPCELVADPEVPSRLSRATGTSVAGDGSDDQEVS